MLKMRKGLVLLTMGLILFICSVSPVFLILRENIIESSAQANYTITYLEPIHDRVDFGGNTIEILNRPSDDLSAVVQLRINEKILGEPYHIQLIKGSAYKYWAWIGVLKIQNKRNNTENLAVVQRIPHHDQDDLTNRQWNIYYLDQTKNVTQEQVSVNDRPNTYLGVKLLMSSGTILSPFGYESDIRYQSGNPYATVIPVVIFIVGTMLTIIGLARYIYNRRA
ncbi:hypothetical protein [Paenibacillus xerothermodurans]|uniref:Uncharacterized protein n=1 Tax=Paenibacillus xerothermodurans TaxID=1977292 RepID=A0A2W1NME8_PAEXE|nr:hypothetical protein [Paenibacillus xerothermodurans]PZE20635.1 hypothetical protein CBW46_012785 [Paenibacillus xerothermodurans]